MEQESRKSGPRTSVRGVGIPLILRVGIVGSCRGRPAPALHQGPLPLRGNAHLLVALHGLVPEEGCGYVRLLHLHQPCSHCTAFRAEFRNSLQYKKANGVEALQSVHGTNRELNPERESGNQLQKELSNLSKPQLLNFTMLNEASLLCLDVSSGACQAAHPPSACALTSGNWTPGQEGDSSPLPRGKGVTLSSKGCCYSTRDCLQLSGLLKG